MIGRPIGEIVATRGGLLDAVVPFARLGDGVRVRAALAESSSHAVTARVVELRGDRVVLAPIGAVGGIAAGDVVESDPFVLALPFGTPLMGRAIDGAGVPFDGRPAARGRRMLAAFAPPAVETRRACAHVMWTGIRALDGPLAIARGARVGLFGAPGAGKSTLLDGVVAGADADAAVVALIGERGREAERRLGQSNARTTIVCAPADRTAAERVRAGEVAVEQADALRRRGLHVLLVIDSLARFCQAARELAVAAGEPAGRGGYPPRVFAEAARLVERAGSFSAGSITLVATVLSDGPEEHDPLSEAVRAALDGHIVLSARLAGAGRFPAIELTKSASRTMAGVVSPEHLAAAGTLRAAVAALDDSRDARSLGLDVAAGDPFLTRCLIAEPEIERFLRQGTERAEPAETLRQLQRLADSLQ